MAPALTLTRLSLAVSLLALLLAPSQSSSSSPPSDAVADSSSSSSSSGSRDKLFKFYMHELPYQVNKHWSDVAFFSPDVTTHAFARGGDWMFFAETFIHDRLMEHPWRTLNASEADIFIVPVYTAVLMHHAHHDIAATNLKAAYKILTEEFPYFKRSSGQDHVFFFTYDLAACHLPEDLPFYRHATHINFLGDPAAPCHSPQKDVVIPAFSKAYLRNGSAALTRPECAPGASLPEREFQYLAHFRGDVAPYDKSCPANKAPIRGLIGPANCVGVHVRNKLFQRYSEEPGFLVSKAKIDFPLYMEELKRTKFCLCPHGRASWTQRFFAAVHVGCVPVVIGVTDITYPFERFVDWSKIVIQISTDDLPSLKSILAAIPPEAHEKMRAAAIRASCTVLTYSETLTNDDAVWALMTELRIKRENMPHLDRLQGKKKGFVEIGAGQKSGKSDGEEAKRKSNEKSKKKDAKKEKSDEL